MTVKQFPRTCRWILRGFGNDVDDENYYPWTPGCRLKLQNRSTHATRLSNWHRSERRRRTRANAARFRFAWREQSACEKQKRRKRKGKGGKRVGQRKAEAEELGASSLVARESRHDTDVSSVGRTNLMPPGSPSPPAWRGAAPTFRAGWSTGTADRRDPRETRRLPPSPTPGIRAN